MDAQTHADAGTIAEHWQKGIPTLILACIGVFVFVYSRWFVRPNLAETYLSYISSTLEQYSIANVINEDENANAKTMERSTTFKSIASALSPAERRQAIEAIEELQIRLRRLVGMDNQNDRLHLQSAFIEQAYAQLLAQDLLEMEVEDVTNSESRLSKLARSEEKLTESLRRVEKLGGKNSATAAGWLVQNAIVGDRWVSIEALFEYEKRLRQQLATHPADEIASQALAMALVEIAIRPSSKLTADQRRNNLNEANSLFGSIDSTAIEVVHYFAYAQQLQNPQAGLEVAAQAAQGYWLRNEKTSAEPTKMRHVLACMLLSGNPREAQLLIRDVISGDSADQASLLRAMFCDCLVKYLQARSIISNTSNIHGNEFDSVALLLTAIQLDPRSDELHRLLDALAVGMEDKPIGKELLIREESKSIIAWLMKSIAIIGRGEELDITPVDATPEVRGSTLVLMSNYLLKQSQSGVIPKQYALKTIESITAIYPDLYPVWFDKAALQIELTEYDKAKESLSLLQEKFPANEQVTTLLEGLNAGTVK